MKLIIIIFITLFNTISFAQLKDHVKSIDERKPYTGEIKKQTTWEKIRSELYGELFGNIFGFLFIPVAPIIWDLLNLPNPKQDPQPSESISTITINKSLANSFEVNEVSTAYRMEGLNFFLSFESGKENTFHSELTTFYTSYTPKWSHLLKPGIGVGIKYLTYSDSRDNSNGNQNGILLNFPTTLSFKNSKWKLLYIPQFIFYTSNRQVIEAEFGSNYSFSDNFLFSIKFNQRAVSGSKSDLPFWSIGGSYGF